MRHVVVFADHGCHNGYSQCCPLRALQGELRGGYTAAESDGSGSRLTKDHEVQLALMREVASLLTDVARLWVRGPQLCLGVRVMAS
jgi:hypothetical protein